MVLSVTYYAKALLVLLLPVGLTTAAKGGLRSLTSCQQPDEVRHCSFDVFDGSEGLCAEIDSEAPFWVAENPTCCDLGFKYEVKVADSGCFNSTANFYCWTNPEDGAHETLSLTCEGNSGFSFESTFPVDYVGRKAGSGSEGYCLAGAVSGDHLGGDLNSKDTSHIKFCFNEYDTPMPSSSPSAFPTESPSATPTDSPTASPSATPTASPSATPTDSCNFECPCGSHPTSECVRDFSDCDCEYGYFKRDGICVPQLIDSCRRSPHVFLYPAPKVSGWQLEVRQFHNPDVPNLIHQDTTTAHSTRIIANRSERNLFYHRIYRKSFQARYLSQCGPGDWQTCYTNTPIGLDIDHSGGVERITGEWSIDITSNGEQEDLFEWFAPTEGILIDGDITIVDGVITGEHLYGDQGGLFADGYEKLRLHDANGDGHVNGAEVEGMAIWVDGNSNAVVDEGEISSLDTYGIVSFDLNDEDLVSVVTLADGSTMIMEDLIFAHDR